MKKPMPTPAEMDGLIACLPLIYGNGPVVIEERDDGSPEQVGILKMSYPVYSDEIQHVFKLAAAEVWKDPDYLSKDAHGMLGDPAFIATASINHIRTMLTQCVRSERFSPGYRATVVKSGQLKQILERLQVLRDDQAPDFEDKFHQPVTITIPQCNTCVHRVRGTNTCAAYPDGIPNGIMSMDIDHSESLPGDHGITYTAIPE